LIIVRRTPAEAKAILAGVMLEASFARFTASMAAFSREMVPSRLLGRCNVAAMVVRGSSGALWPRENLMESAVHLFGRNCLFPTVHGRRSGRPQFHLPLTYGGRR